MKRISILSAGAFAALALAGCQTSTKPFTLTGEGLPADLNGKYAYFYHPAEKEAFDSVQIADGAFTKVFEATDTTAYHVLRIERNTLYVIPEAGEVKVVPSEEKGFTVEPADQGGLNARLAKFSADKAELMAPFDQQFEQLYNDYRAKEKEGFKDDAEKLQMENLMEELGKKQSAELNKFAGEVYRTNKDNALGVLAFSSMVFEDEELLGAVDNASDLVKNDPSIKQAYDRAKTAMATGEGQHYTDFTIDDGMGNTAKLSDYLTDGRYLLVDFWASWCGPCRKAMPHLADIVKDHAKTIRVLSVGVWEASIEDNNKAKEELGMTWETLFDKESKAVEVYGIDGIPTMLLIAPDGTIVTRTHDPEDITKKMAELKL